MESNLKQNEAASNSLGLYTEIWQKCHSLVHVSLPWEEEQASRIPGIQMEMVLLMYFWLILIGLEFGGISAYSWLWWDQQGMTRS